MDEVINRLGQFSVKHDLWEKTKIAGMESIKNYLKEDTLEAGKLFPRLSIENIVFEMANQKLTFWKHGASSFIVSTTYNLFTDSKSKTSSPVGYYTLDTDDTGAAVDDWLVFH